MGVRIDGVVTWMEAELAYRCRVAGVSGEEERDGCGETEIDIRPERVVMERRS